MTEVFGIKAFMPGFVVNGHNSEGEEFWTKILKVDAFLSEKHKGVNKKTKYATESGSYINTRLKQMPTELDIEGVITDTPIDLFNPATGIIKSVPGRAKEIQKQIEALRGKVFSVNTTLGIYDYYTFDELIWKQEVSNGCSIGFSARISKFRAAKSATGGEEQYLDDRVVRTATRKQYLGRRVAKEFFL